MIDQIYTPEFLADKLVAAALEFVKEPPKTIADFACGDGSLLLSARRCLGSKAKYIANDIDPEVLRNLNWCSHLYSEDFTKYERRFNKLFRKIDLILLNPPFSYMPSTSIDFAGNNGFTTKCSPAMSFILNAIDFLSYDGIIAGIFPESILWSERDEKARKHLEFIGYSIEKVESLPNKIFTGYTVATAILRIKRGKAVIASGQKFIDETTIIERGKIQVHHLYKHTVNSSKKPLYIHTTDLQGGRIRLTQKVRVDFREIVTPPYILLPRVGKPDAGKIVKVTDGKYVASDCIIYIKPNNPDIIETIYREIVGNIDKYYGGSCAKYTTIRRVRENISHITRAV